MQALLSIFSWRYPMYLVELWRRHASVLSYYLAFWQTTQFSALKPVAGGDPRRLHRARVQVVLLYTLAVVEITAGIMLGLWWHHQHTVGGWQFALALVVAYPLVLAHAVPLVVGVSWLLQPKALGRAIICGMLESQVKRLRKRHSFTVIGVVGSLGKTSTKMAIARTLSVARRVQWQEGNYNDRVTIPLIFFGQNEPPLLNVPAWARLLWQNERQLRGVYPHQVVVAELGTDWPGQLREFAYIKPDLVVVTAIAAEHMEFFKTLDGVAAEELSALDFSKQALINTDETDAKYLKGRTYTSYGLSGKPAYTLKDRTSKGLRGQRVTFKLAKESEFTLDTPLLGEQGAKIVLAAAAAAHVLGIPVGEIEKGVGEVTAFAGRMQILPGKMNSTLIDDSYNAAPVPVKAALDVLQSGDAPQRIAILGSMRELGEYTPEAHREVAEHCDPTKLDWVVTVGAAARDYLAPVAKERGCQVKSFLSPHDAGKFVAKQLREGAVVLAKGSQNYTFTEEALKPLLADPADAAKLVRQSPYWMAQKAKQLKT